MGRNKVAKKSPNIMEKKKSKRLSLKIAAIILYFGKKNIGLRIGVMSIKLFEHFKFIPFIIAFIVGLIFITLRKPDDSQRVVKWPHPSNVKDTIYSDKNGLCYKYNMETIDCKTIKEKLKDFPFE